MFKLLKHLFSRKENLPNVILLGIGAPSYALAKVLIEQRKAKIAAFIDDEPWNNRTDILGVTVRYPSDLVALIERRGVTQVIGFIDDFQLTQDVLEEVERAGVKVLLLDKSLTVKQWLEQF